MSGPVRQAGTSVLGDGARLVWSVADGRRGRRWRAAATVDGAISHALLLEVDLDGRPSRLELATAAGMLTLHPERSHEALHGNVVAVDGVRHLRLPWSDEHGLEIADRPLATVVTVHRLAGSMEVGEERTVPVIMITADLAVSEATRRFIRLGPSEWRIEGEGDASRASSGRLVAVDGRGLPSGLRDGLEWPLELATPG
ncbi:MAG: hypothetical protein QOJ75_321 [Chloroflexota bacterium]|jgi:hypothetical protein|nr:hypothetical protein [Chloroflexota bacterium]